MKEFWSLVVHSSPDTANGKLAIDLIEQLTKLNIEFAVIFMDRGLEHLRLSDSSDDYLHRLHHIIKHHPDSFQVCSRSLERVNIAFNYDLLKDGSLTSFMELPSTHWYNL